MTFPEKLITLRAGRGWSQEKLAGELGVTRQAVGRWERGECLPDAMGLTRLAQTFDVNPNGCSTSPPQERLSRVRHGRRSSRGFIISPSSLRRSWPGVSVRQADICGQLELFDRGPAVVAARADSDKTARLARTGLGSCGAAAASARPQSRRVRWALIIARAVLPAHPSAVRWLNMFWLHWYRTQHTTWVINSPSMLVIGGLLLGMAAKRRDKMS